MDEEITLMGELIIFDEEPGEPDPHLRLRKYRLLQEEKRQGLFRRMLYGEEIEDNAEDTDNPSD